MTRVLGLFLLLCITTVASAKVYEKVDDDGAILFTDIPSEGANVVALTPTSEIPWRGTSAPKEEKETEPSETPKSFQLPRPEYTLFRIASPTQNQYIRSNEGELNIVMAIKPALYPGDKFKVYIDSQALPSTFDSESFSISGIVRGSHSLRIELLTSENEAIRSAPPVKFFMYRNIAHTPTP